MVESIAFALLVKKLQIGMIGFGILLASVLTVYNLPWNKDGEEWETLVSAIRKLKTVSFRTFWKTKWVENKMG